MRKFLIAGNWKMNNGPSATQTLISELKNACNTIPDSIDVLICPPHVSLTIAAETIGSDYTLSLGAQNVYFEDQGAYTGETAAVMLKEIGCDYVILGHSERREYFSETDNLVNLKTRKALAEGLKPIVCVGESLEQRNAGDHKRLVRQQVEAALNGIEESMVTGLVIAYEPIWAIGTGETATPEQAQEMHSMIRGELKSKYGDQAGNAIRILYGGSMKPQNAEELLGQQDVDGGLIGGASLKADSFSEIIRIAETIAT